MEVVLAAHSGVRWLVVIGLVAVIAWAFTGERPTIPAWVRGVGGILALQMLLGLVLYVVNQAWEYGPFLAVWHPLAMIGAIGVFQATTARVGRGDGTTRTLGFATLLSLALVLGGIPWFRGLM